MSGISPVDPSTALTAATAPAKAADSQTATPSPPRADTVAISSQAQQLLSGDKDHDGDSH